MLKAKRRTKIIRALIDERIMNSIGKPVTVKAEDARDAVHAVVEIAGRESHEDLRKWQQDVFTWMFGENGQGGLLEPRTIKLPICYAKLVAAPTEKATVLLHDVTVRTPRDIWQVALKQEGRTVLV